MGGVGRPLKAIAGTGPMADLAEALRLLKKEADLTYTELESSTGLSRATLSKAFSGEKITPRVIERIAQACHADPRQWSERLQDAQRLAEPETPTMASSLRARQWSEVRIGSVPVPVTAETVTDFMAYLDRAGTWAGSPSIRELAKKVGMAPSTLHLHIRRDRRELPNRTVLMQVLDAYGVPDKNIAEWIYAWNRLKDQEKRQSAASSRARLYTVS